MQVFALIFVCAVATSMTEAHHFGPVSRKWELIFHARAGNGEKVMPAFYGTHSKCASKAGVSCRIQDGCFQDAIDPSAVLLLKSEPKHHLRSSIIDHWVNANIKMVKVSLFKDGEEVAYIVFNAVGSTKDNWFHNTRILESSWCDILTNGKYNIFSISGAENERTFNTNNVHDGCPGESGWLFLSEGNVECSFDKQKKYPQFYYAQKGTVTRWNLQEFGKADVFAIFIIKD